MRVGMRAEKREKRKESRYRLALVHYRKPKDRDEQAQPSSLGPQSWLGGFVSIFAVLIIMGILTLIMVGFSALVRRTQQQTLDNQLSNQAFYAAESGVNDAAKVLASNPAYSKTSCQDTVNDPPQFVYTLDSSSSTGYTCVLVSTTNSSLDFSNVPVQGQSSPITFNLRSSSANNVSKFDITWSSSITSTKRSDTALPVSSSWGNNLGMLRLDLAPDDVTSGYDRASLVTKSFTFFLYPTSAGSNGPFTVSSAAAAGGSANQGQVYYVNNCSVSGGSVTCTATIQLNPVSTTKYVARLQSLYTSSNVSIRNGFDSSGASISWVAGQANIDVTGKAKDVFRRIQVRLPINQNGLMPTFSLQSANSVCKILSILPGDTQADRGGGFGAVLNDTSNADDSCAIN